ncbi:MAG TPA: sn-glycerol-3-phosphate ABC transporter ATP-binding protein UgpC [Bauldia sp.]|nr:sn-glycerol-3-phosphate ABC transporter ATP-binding protein UgpC [Bauldia sp.]
MSEVRLEAVRKNFGSVEIIRDVDLAIASGEFVVFVGPSGCGKSTLLRMISGLESVASGRILIDGRDVTRLAPGERQVAMVFQSYALYPHMTAVENMSFGLRMTGAPRAEIEARVAEAARILQIEPLLERKPKQLSGGQRQRVAIGRAIVRHPKVFLFDEPLSNLDAALRVQMRVEIARLHAEIGATMIYVTHDQVEAMTLANRIVVLNRGVVEQVGAPIDLYDRPANRFVAGFIGQPKMNFLDATVAYRRDGLVALTLPAAAAPLEVPLPAPPEADTPVTLGVRPNALTLADRPADLAGRVAVVEHLGSESIVHVAVEGVADLVTVVAPGRTPLRHGDAVALAIDRNATHVFDRSGRTM